MEEIGIKAEDFKIKRIEDLSSVRISKPNYKSIIIIGNLNINNTAKFNWFQRLMWKICFNAKVINLKKEE